MHRQVKGSVRVDGKLVSLSKYCGTYPVLMAKQVAKIIMAADNSAPVYDCDTACEDAERWQGRPRNLAQPN